MIKYTRHAKNRMRLHNITEEEIGQAISSPDFTESSTEEKLNAWKETAGKYLRVTFKEEPEKLLIITAVKKKKGWR